MSNFATGEYLFNLTAGIKIDSMGVRSLHRLELKKLLVSLLACFGAASLGSVITQPAISDWYTAVKRPAFAPPNEVFAPVWTLLYV
jgi:hypothetical protein